MASQRHDIEHNVATSVAALSIKNAQPQDIGTYRVEAENAAGKCETQGKLFVEAVPDIDETAHVNPSLFRALDAPKGQGAAAPAQQPVLIVNPLQACLFSGAYSSFFIFVIQSKTIVVQIV